MEQHLYGLLISGQQGCKASQLALLKKFEPLLKKYAWYLSYEDALQDLQLGFLQLIQKWDVKQMEHICDNSIVVDFPIEKNNGVQTIRDSSDASTMDDGTVCLVNSSGMDPKVKAYHEIVHNAEQKHPEEYADYFETIKSYLNFISPQFIKVEKKISEAYFKENFDFTKDYERFYREFAAHFTGEYAADPEGTREALAPMFHDFSAVEEAYRKFDAAINPETAPSEPSAGTVSASLTIMTVNPKKSITSRERRALSALCRKSGVSIVVEDHLPEELNGYYSSRSNSIHISADSANPVVSVAAHEIVHAMRHQHPEEWAELVSIARRAMPETGLRNLETVLREAHYKEKDISDEVAAHYIQTVVGDIGEFEKLVGINRTLAQRIVDALDAFLLRLRKADTIGNNETNAALRELMGHINYGESVNAVEEMKKALRSSGAKSMGQGVALLSRRIFKMVKENKSFADQFADYKSGKMGKNDFFFLGDTPQKYVAAGVNQNPIVMSPSVVKKAQRGEKIDIHRHNLYDDIVKSLPHILANPVLLLQSDTVDNAVLAVTSGFDSSNNPVVIALHIDRMEGFDVVNRIASFYGRNNFRNFLFDQLQRGRLIGYSKKEANRLLHHLGLQLPVWNTAIDFDTIKVPQPAPGVNSYSTQQSQKDSKQLPLDRMKELAEEHGALPKGERPARDIAVPVRDENGGQVTRGTRTILESSATPDSMLDENAAEIVAGMRSYEVIPDKHAVAYAEDYIRGKGYDAANAQFEAAMSANGIPTKKDLVLGEYLMMEAGRANDSANAMRYAAEVAAAATRAGQTVQAMRLIKKLTPTGQLFYLTKAVEGMNKNIEENGGKKIIIDDAAAQKLAECEQITDKTVRDRKTQEVVREVEKKVMYFTIV